MSSLIIEDLRRVEGSLAEAVSLAGGPVAELALGTLEAGGKRLRPALVLICGQIGEYEFERLLPAAVAVELVHMASLIHDDVLDLADTRRGRPTIFFTRGERQAVAAGDFLFARAFELLAIGSDTTALAVLSGASVALCLGELEQSRTAHIADQSVELYLEKIGYKTASLFSACCRLGGLLAGTTEGEMELLDVYGYELGTAFQIYDDILDLTGGSELGKPVGADLRDGTVTMPMLYAMEELREREALTAVIESGSPSDREVADAIELILGTHAIERTKTTARDYVNRALEAAGRLPDKALGLQLETIGEFVIDRYK